LARVRRYSNREIVPISRPITSIPTNVKRFNSRAFGAHRCVLRVKLTALRGEAPGGQPTGVEYYNHKGIAPKVPNYFTFVAINVISFCAEKTLVARATCNSN
jgi:hypothetical protein